MNKTAIKNFAIWARNKLITDISYKAGLLGITEKGIKSPLPQSTQTVQFFDIGTKEPSSITGLEIQQRKKLVEEIERKAKQSDYSTAYKNVIEEVAYTWFNRLIAIRFMEVNDYLPTRIRVLSSESNGKVEPDLVTHALEASLDYSAYEKDRIIQLKHENKLDELFRMLFIKQCNALNANLAELFEKTSDYTELLLNVSFTDKEGVIYHLVNDIDESDFNVSKEGQVEIIGWLYQYYNTEPKDETFALLKKNVKITKERIPAATQLFTPDWIVRYMVENSLGRLWIEGHPNDELKANWKYYLDEAEQEEEVQKQLDKIREDSKNKKPENIKVIDPAMGSGHILVYAFDVLLQIYESYGYSQRDAAKNIIEKNLYGLDIDNRAYQLAYFAVMMKARQYNRRILNGETICHLYAIQESNDIDKNQLKYFGVGLSDLEKNSALLQIQELLDTFIDAKEFGSILNSGTYNWDLLKKFINCLDSSGQMSVETIGIENTSNHLKLLIKTSEILFNSYDVVITNPPYMSSSGMSNTLFKYVKNNFVSAKSDLFAVFIKKCGELCKINGFYSLITQHSWMFLSDYTKLRSEIGEKILINMAHLGTRAFDEISGEIVQTTAFTMRNNSQKNYNGTYLRLVDENSESLKQNLFLSGKNRYYSKFIDYAIIPGSPIVYWASRAILKNFKEGRPMNSLISPRQGLATTDNKKFLRLWYEVSLKRINFDIKSISEAAITEIKWVPYNKGGSRRQWYGNYDYVVDWSNNGKEIKENVMNKYTYLSSPDFVVKNTDFYFREAITWSLIASNGFSIRYRTPGSIHDVSGMSAFSDNRNLLMYILGLMSTKIANHIFKMLNPTINLQIGDFNNFPVITTEHADIPRIVNDSIKIAKEDWDSFETSWDFRVHPLINSNSIEDAYKRWKDIISSRFSKLKQNEEELNQIFIKIYGLERELTAAIEDEEITIRRENINEDIRSLISYAVGCIFGRYSLDVEGITFAGDNWDENKYKSYIPDKDNIIPITDEEYFQDDIIERIVSFIRIIYGESKLEENLNFIARVLNEKGDSSREVIRTYFVKSFFKDHCKVYQKRPIYWLFDSGKQNGFKALVYMHRFDENTIGNLRIDYLHRLQRIYENEIGRMQDAIENSDDARDVTAATKRKEKLIKQLQETKEYDEKIAHLALARTPIDLDDGVKVNYEKVQTDRDGKKLDVLAKI